MKKISAVIMVSFILLGCNGDNVEIAKKQVSNFRDMCEHDEFNSIYKNSANKMKEKVSPDEFVIFISSAKKEMGKLNKTQLTHSNSISYVIGEPAVVLTYSSRFSKRNYKEVFSFVSESGEMKLSGYSYTPN